eukprot:s1970_g15.t1
MHDLVGMDSYLTVIDVQKLSATERALLSALHSGAFISASEHARYDSEKLHICPHCQCEDDRAHWLICPRFRSLRLSIDNWYPDNVELPTCMTHHLLVPRLPDLVLWRSVLYDLQDGENKFFYCPSNGKLQHVFTDGACSNADHPCLRLASWGVLSATDGEPVCLGHLAGIMQTIDRAELTALVMATRWTVAADLYIWSDSLSNVNLAAHIQRCGWIPDNVENYDLWLQLHDALSLRQGWLTVFRWVPSHIHVSLADDPFEAWLFTWNNAIDGLVTHWNQLRPSDFLQQHAALAKTLHWWSERVLQLRTFYFKVATAQSSSASPLSSFDPIPEIIEIDSDGADEMTGELLMDLLPLTWQVTCRQTPCKVPGCFVESILQWFCTAEQFGCQPLIISEVELVFLLAMDTDFCFPFQLDGTTNWTMRRLVDLFQRPTFAMLLRPVQWTMQHLEKLFPEVLIRTPPKPSKEIGVYMNFRGVKACISRTLLDEAREKLASFTASRGIRKTSDLARPWT